MDFLKGIKSVWKALKESTKPILIYGMGDGANKIFNIMMAKGIGIEGIFASDEFVRGQSFLGHRVMTYDEAVSKYEDFVIVLAFGTSIPELMDKLNNMYNRHEFFAPDVPLFGGDLFDDEYISENQNKIEESYELMYDGQSKFTFESIIKYKYSGDIKYLFECETARQEVFENIFKFNEEETYMDLGAYDGDTVEEFVDIVNGVYKKIIAVEPAEKNFEKLQSNIEQYGQGEKIQCLNIGIYDRQGTANFSGKSGRNAAILDDGKRLLNINSIDNIAGEQKITYIKMDIEGAERAGILGGVNVIKKHQPKLAVSAYHRTDDIFDIPLLINSINKDYKIFLRHHPYIPAWETNIYCIV